MSLGNFFFLIANCKGGPRQLGGTIPRFVGLGCIIITEWEPWSKPVRSFPPSFLPLFVYEFLLTSFRNGLGTGGVRWRQPFLPQSASGHGASTGKLTRMGTPLSAKHFRINMSDWQGSICVVKVPDICVSSRVFSQGVHCLLGYLDCVGLTISSLNVKMKAHGSANSFRLILVFP